MSKISKLNELKEQVRAEKIRIATETIAELRAGTFDISADEAVQALEIAKDHVDYKVFYQKECRSEALWGWHGLWTSRDEAKVEQLYADLHMIEEALKKANEALWAKIPF